MKETGENNLPIPQNKPIAQKIEALVNEILQRKKTRIPKLSPLNLKKRLTGWCMNFIISLQ
jgi:hypothetical protein